MAAFKKAADETASIVFAKIDPAASPELAERFEVSDKSILLG